MWLAIWMAVILLFTSNSLARDDGRYAQSPNKDWFNGLQNQRKNNCCSSADGLRIEDPDWNLDGGTYNVRLNGVWHKVDDQALVTVPNKVGYAIVWPYIDNGKTLIRCFMPGSTS